MSAETRPKPTHIIACDICGEEIPESTYRGGRDHRGTLTREGHGVYTGSVLFGWIARTVSNVTARAHLTWPPPSWSRTKKWDERPAPRTYDFHGECILRLVEDAAAQREPIRSTSTDPEMKG